jgi:hypothetical protein
MEEIMAESTSKKTITLFDGSTVEVQPLKISLLRPFMEKFQELQGVAEDNAKSMDVLVECAQIALKQYKPELAADKTVLEDSIDLPTVYAIIDAASGIQLADASVFLNN